MDTKTCGRCLQDKPTNEFYTRTYPNGKQSLWSYCKKCMNKHMIDYQKRPNRREKSTEATKKYIKNNRQRRWATRTISTHKQENQIVSLQHGELAELALRTTHCKFCLRPLNWNHSKTQDDSPSLDRLDNKPVLSIKEIAIVCFKCNKTKQDRSVSEFIQYMEQVLPRLRQLAN